MWIWPLLMILGGVIKPLSPFNFEYAALATERVIAHLLTHPLSQNFLAYPIIKHFRVAGIVSYSIYLLHDPFLYWLRKALPSSLTNDIHPFFIFLLCMGAWIPILSLAWLFYRFIEIPSINLGKQFLRQRQSASFTFPEHNSQIVAKESIDPKPHGPLPTHVK